VLVVLGAVQASDFAVFLFFLCGSWQWPAVRLFRFCATQRLGTRTLEKKKVQSQPNAN
jgi:hypothetical protein